MRSKGERRKAKRRGSKGRWRRPKDEGRKAMGEEESRRAKNVMGEWENAMVARRRLIWYEARWRQRKTPTSSYNMNAA